MVTLSHCIAFSILALHLSIYTARHISNLILIFDMHFMHIEEIFLPEARQIVLDKLSSVQTNYDNHTVENHDANIATEICSLIQKSKEIVINVSGNESIHAIGQQGRYLIYIDHARTIPKFVVTLSYHGAFARTKKSIKNYGNQNMRQSSVKKAYKFRVFMCHGEFDDTKKEHDFALNKLLKSMSNVTTKNEDMIRNTHAYTRKNSCRRNDTSRTLSSSSDIGLNVSITQDNIIVSVIPILSMGLQRARHALRNIGALCKPCHQIDDESISIVPIAQNHQYAVSMVIFAGAFHLRLQRMEDIFTCTGWNAEAVSLTTMSHRFHFLDSVIEHVIEEKHTHINQTCHVKVSGMLAVVHELLRLSVTSVPIRSLGANCMLNMHAEMLPHDIAKTLRVMGLVTDNRRIANSLNARLPGIVVQHVSSQDILNFKFIAKHQNDTLTNIQENSSDFRIHRSGVLNHAIAHQNIGVTSKLNHTNGLNIQDISIALYSGIAFCHACAYDRQPLIIDRDFRAHLINSSDFPEHRMNAIHEFLETEATAMLSTLLDLQWTTLRHNFHVQDNSNHVGMHSLKVECYVSTSGLVFFRRSRDVLSTEEVSVFFGAVYILPSLIDKKSQGTYRSRASPCAPDEHSHQSHNSQHSQYDTPRHVHKVVHLMSQLSSQVPVTDVLFLRNATETLFHINCICIHNAFNAEQSQAASQKTSGSVSSSQHRNLRKVWLHTYVSRAFKLFAPSQRADFYRSFAYLSNLTDLPLDSAGYWNTIPYI
jgi:hypothetical protein